MSREIAEVRKWLEQLRVNALAVENPELAANCELAIAVIVCQGESMLCDKAPADAPQKFSEKPPQRSTREIVMDSQGAKHFGHNPSWVKAVDHERIVAELLQALDDMCKLYKAK